MYYRRTEHLASLFHERDTFIYFCMSLLAIRFHVLALRICIYGRWGALLLGIGVVAAEIKREFSVSPYF
jgi:hypothetical protein